MHIEHSRLLVNNFAACFRFYQQIMGLKVTWGTESDSYASFTDRDGQRPRIALFKREEMASVLDTSELPSEAPSQDRFVLIVQVVDVDATYQELVARGLSFEIKPQSYPDWGIRSAYLRDPDGNLIELSSGLDPDEWSDDLVEATQRFTEV